MLLDACMHCCTNYLKIMSNTFFFFLNIVGGRVHGLRQIYKRIEEETYPLPSSYDVTNYLTYFHQILLGYVNVALFITVDSLFNE